MKMTPKLSDAVDALERTIERFVGLAATINGLADTALVVGDPQHAELTENCPRIVAVVSKLKLIAMAAESAAKRLEENLKADGTTPQHLN